MGEWQPVRVPTTAQKKRVRITVLGAFAVTITGCFLLGNLFYRALMGGRARSARDPAGQPLAVLSASLIR